MPDKRATVIATMASAKKQLDTGTHFRDVAIVASCRGHCRRAKAQRQTVFSSFPSAPITMKKAGVSAGLLQSTIT
jgi:hypothetical protein